MLKAMTARRGDDRGFTLVELMVVVLIIGILVAIAIPTFLNARKTAENTAAQANLRNAYSVAKAFQAAHNGSYVGFVGATEDASLPWGAGTCTADGCTIKETVVAADEIKFETETPSGSAWSATDANGALEFDCTGDSCPTP